MALPRTCCCDTRTFLLIVIGISIVLGVISGLQPHVGIAGLIVGILIDCVGMYGAWKHRPVALKIYAGIKAVFILLGIILTIVLVSNNGFKQSIHDSVSNSNNTDFDAAYNQALIFIYCSLAISVLYNMFVIFSTRKLWLFYESVEGQEYLNQTDVELGNRK
ncbi:hypothetical protein HDV04_002148 [Boothiomyces sp. JEL0838]|nr:hypothetical protein HDV04_002148 [Boothiomyces sp. JEL0838]